MTYQQTLDYLFTRLPMYSRIGAAAYKDGLTNIKTLCEALGHPENKFKSVHIAGTNGKGSTSHMLAAVFQTAGYSTGLYTSPHLRDFRERIRLNGQFIPEDFVVDFVARIEPQINAIEPSFFEITVAMAFDFFASRQVDIAIVEVGLGGRLDSTNIIEPELSIITNIGWDHMQMLGNTLNKIAFEKAGIIKPGIPVVVGETLPETEQVFVQKSLASKSSLQIASEEFFVTAWQEKQYSLSATVANHQNDERTNYELDLQGIYQLKNLCTVLSALAQLRKKGWTISHEHETEALRQVRSLTGLHGRWEIMHRHPTIVMDVAHNEDGIRQLSSQLEISDYDHLHIIIGLVKDKDIAGVMALLPRQASYYFTRAQIPRALPEDELADAGRAAGLNGQTIPDVNTALETALSRAGKNDLILVCGSVFLVGEVERFGNNNYNK